MKYKRRDFVKLTSGLFLTGLSGIDIFSLAGGNKKIKTFGLQLWTVKDDMIKDPGGVIKKIASLGYKQVESFDGDGSKEIYWGMRNTEFKKLLDDNDINMISTHCVVEKDFEKKVAEAAEIGLKYLIFQWEGPGKTLDDYKKYADDFNVKGEICKKNGLRFGYHNHYYSFQPIDGQYPQDILMNRTDPSLVDFQMDFFYVVATKNDPEKWLKKYPGRFKLCHVKDLTKGTNGKNISCTLGKGTLNFSKILKTASQNGMQYYLVEQEDYENTTPLDSIVADADYMKRLRI